MKIFQYWKIWNCNSIQIKNFEFASSTVKMQNKGDINNKIKKILKVLYKKYMMIPFFWLSQKVPNPNFKCFFYIRIFLFKKKEKKNHKTDRYRSLFLIFMIHWEFKPPMIPKKQSRMRNSKMKKHEIEFCTLVPILANLCKKS